MGLLDGLGQLATNAITPVANARAAYLSGQQEAEDRKLSQGMQVLALQRQQQQDDLSRALGAARVKSLGSQASAADALARSRDMIPGENKQDANGEYTWLPKRQPIGGIGSNPGLRIAGEGAPRSSLPEFSPPSPADLGGQLRQNADGLNGLPPTASTAAPGARQSAAALSSVFSQNLPSARPTGVFGPVKAPPAQHAVTAQIGGRPVLGRVDSGGMFSADTTAQGDTVFGKPPAVGRSSANPADIQLNHTINNVRSQIAETQAQFNAAQKQALSGAGLLASPDQKQAAAVAGAQARTLKTRLDSLQGVHDVLIKRQQDAQHLSRVVPLAGSSDAGNSPSPAAGMSHDTAQQMQDEFDEASRNLNAILQSGAAPEVKQRAKALYDQQQTAIAHKYNPPRSPQP